MLLFNRQPHFQQTFPSSIGHAGNRRGLAIVAPGGHADIAFVRADPVGDMLPRLAKRAERDAKRRGDRVAARIPKTKPTAPLASIAGTYADKIYGEATIVDDLGNPILSFRPAKELLTGKLVHWHYDTWMWEHADPFLEPGYITFQFDGNHQVIGFKVELHSPDFHFYKLDFRKQ